LSEKEQEKGDFLSFCSPLKNFCILSLFKSLKDRPKNFGWWREFFRSVLEVLGKEKKKISEGTSQQKLSVPGWVMSENLMFWKMK
jgi:hypothetical protein